MCIFNMGFGLIMGIFLVCFLIVLCESFEVIVLGGSMFVRVKFKEIGMAR